MATIIEWEFLNTHYKHITDALCEDGEGEGAKSYNILYLFRVMTKHMGCTIIALILHLEYNHQA